MKELFSKHAFHQIPFICICKISEWEIRGNLELHARPTLFADVPCTQNAHLLLASSKKDV